MKFIYFTLIWVAMLGCANLPFSTASITPKSVYKLELVTMISPDEPNWALMQNEIHSLVLAKKFDDKSQTALITAMMYPAGTHKTSQAFLEYIISERKKNDDKNRFKILEVKNEFVQFKNLPCVKYQTLAEDHKDEGIASSDIEYFKTQGYICRYPLEYIAFQAEISHRSKVNKMPSDISKTGQKFFENIQFVDGTIKRLKTIP